MPISRTHELEHLVAERDEALESNDALRRKLADIGSVLGLANWHLLGNCHCPNSIKCLDEVQSLITKAILLRQE